MPKEPAKLGSELFIVDNTDQDWKVLQYVRDWCGLSQSIDIATGFFEIGALLGLNDQWQKVDHIRVLMGDEVSQRTKNPFVEGLVRVTAKLDSSPKHGDGEGPRPAAQAQGRRPADAPPHLCLPPGGGWRQHQRPL